MKKMKRFLGIMIAMIMAVTMLAGCGGNGKGNSDSTEGNTLKFGCFSYSESLDPANMINAEVIFSTRFTSPFWRAIALLSSLKKSISTLS